MPCTAIDEQLAAIAMFKCIVQNLMIQFST